jgi:hypothetical protein
MRRPATIAAILAGSYAVAAILTPPDPFSCLIGTAAISVVAAASYVAGLIENRTAPGRPRNGTVHEGAKAT